MNKVLAITSLIFVGLHTPAQAQSENPFSSGELVSRNTFYQIPYKDTRKEIFTAGYLRGQKHQFMMDSGAPTFISKALHDRYHYPPLEQQHMKDVSGNESSVSLVLIDSIRFGPFLYRNIPALVLDLSTTPLECDRIAGNLGSNLLRHLVVQFDIATNKISFATDRSLLKKPAQRYSPMKVDQQSDPYFPIYINEAVTDTIHFDTGDGYLYHISQNTAYALAARCPSCVIREGFGTMAVGITGAGRGYDQQIFRSGSIRIAGETINNGLIYVTPNNRSRMGRRLLDYGILELYYPASRYSFTRYPNPVPAPMYDYGMYPVVRGKTVTVGIVWKGSAADRCGIKSGDELLEMNDITLKGLKTCRRDEAITTQLQEPILQIKVKTGAKTYTCKLTRTEL
jgi:hypothetical protein